MTSVVLCPNCGGQKTVSKPPYIAGDVNAWVGSGTPTYPCPTCDGRGWIRVDSTSQDDFDNVKLVALSSMETAENLMDECTKRADRIKELEATTARLESDVKSLNTLVGEKELRIIDLKSMCSIARNAHNRREEELHETIDDLVAESERTRAGERVADKEIERLRAKILDIEGREYLVTTELEHRASAAEDRLRVVKEMRDELLEDWEVKRATVIRDEADLELLEDILKIVNPLIKSGNYAQPMAFYQMLSKGMNELCRTVIDFRRKHDIVE